MCSVLDWTFDRSRCVRKSNGWLYRYDYNEVCLLKCLGRFHQNLVIEIKDRNYKHIRFHILLFQKLDAYCFFFCLVLPCQYKFLLWHIIAMPSHFLVLHVRCSFQLADPDATETVAEEEQNDDLLSSVENDSSEASFCNDVTNPTSDHEMVSKMTLQWLHNECYGVSNHRRIGCLLNRLFRRGSRKPSKLRVAGICDGNPPVIHLPSRCQFLFCLKRYTYTIIFIFLSVSFAIVFSTGKDLYNGDSGRRWAEWRPAMSCTRWQQRRIFLWWRH